MYPWLDDNPAQNRHPLDGVLRVRAPAAPPASCPVIFNDFLALNKSASGVIDNHEGGVFGTGIKAPYTIFNFGGGHTYRAANFGVALVAGAPGGAAGFPVEDGACHAVLAPLGAGATVHDVKVNTHPSTLGHVAGVCSVGLTAAAPSSRT